MVDKVKQLVDEHLKDTHLFLQEVKESPGRLEVVIDGDAGVNINECAEISRMLHKAMEEQGIDMSNQIVDVSSPGIDIPLRNTREFKKNVGRNLAIRMYEGRKIQGTLVMASDEGVLIATGRGKKMEALTYGDVQEAKVLV